MIRHLLVLKEQLAPFEANLVHSGKELDFSHVTGRWKLFDVYWMTVWLMSVTYDRYTKFTATKSITYL